MTKHKTVPFEEFRRAVVPAAGRALIAGSKVYGSKCDRRLAFDDALGVDMLEGEGVDRVLDLEEPLPADMGTFAHVECCSVLEHSRRPWLLAANLERVLAAGGTLYVTVPFVWRVHAYPSDYFRFTTEGIRQLFPGIEWHSLVYAHLSLTAKSKVPSRMLDGHPYFARTEVCGFGVKAS